MQKQTSVTMPPNGTRLIKNHQPVRSVSCSRRTDTASPGRTSPEDGQHGDVSACVPHSETWRADGGSAGRGTAAGVRRAQLSAALAEGVEQHVLQVGGVDGGVGGA